MIHFLEGVVDSKGPDNVVLNVNGIGFLVKVSIRTVEEVGAVGSSLVLHTCLLVRDDNPVLYGFCRTEERSLFMELTSVTGVGPRLALALLGAMTPGELASAVVAGDTWLLSRIPGIGKKTAARLCVELASKLNGYISGGDAGAQVMDAELVEALIALGFSSREAVDAARKMGGDEGLSLEQRIRQALQALSSR